MKYLKSFENHSQYNEYAGGGGMLKPNVSHCVSENEVHYNPIPHDYKKDYFTIESLEDSNTIYLKTSNSARAKTVSASTDNGETWAEYASSTDDSGTTLATLNKGNKLLIKGENGAYENNSFIATKQIEVKGNIMSLINGDSFTNAHILAESSTFRYLFYQCTGLTSAENLILPATTLADNCYGDMFRGCTSLTAAPELPATTLGIWCYSYMFAGCTSLTTAPELPAITLTFACYQAMFRDCTSLTTAPQLPSTALAEHCYQSMFRGCTSLTAAPELPATTLGIWCYSYMFAGCTSLTTAPELPATTLTDYCYESMFQRCTGLTTAPNLPATTLTQGCYWEMFGGCTSLNSITCLATDISASRCTNVWVTNVAANGTFTKASSMTSWTTGVSGIPDNWAIQDAT